MIANDKLIHFLGSFMACVVLAKFLSVEVAVAITALLGLAKEYIWDRAMGRGTFEINDMIADAVGIILALLILM